MVKSVYQTIHLTYMLMVKFIYWTVQLTHTPPDKLMVKFIKFFAYIGEQKSALDEDLRLHTKTEQQMGTVTFDVKGTIIF